MPGSGHQIRVVKTVLNAQSRGQSWALHAPHAERQHTQPAPLAASCLSLLSRVLIPYPLYA